jgi:hypothetical protein
VRQQQRDLGLLMQFMRDCTERQSQLFFLVSTFLVRYEPPELHAIIDDDVAQAVSALASTYETASRGVIYEHRPASLQAERLASALKPVLAEAGQNGGSPFERDAAAVLRRIGEAVNSLKEQDPGHHRVFLDLLGRVIRQTDGPAHDREAVSGSAGTAEGADRNDDQQRGTRRSRLIVP